MEKKDFKAESKRLMDLMVNSIYTHKEIFLREIISNASDALDKLHFISLTDETAEKLPELFIKIDSDKENRTLTVSDNGIGMSYDELEENLGTIAKSGSFQFKKDLSENEKTDIIGQFGVGFYSAFMVSDNVTVITKKHNSDKAYKWNSTGADGYTIEETEKADCGTEIIMHIREDADGEDYSQYLENYKIQSLVKKYSDYISFPIKMEVESSVNTAKEDEEPKYEMVKEIKTLNSMVPIWRRNKNEVTQEEYNNYYKEKFMDMTDPLVTINVSAEGTVSYKALMYIPAVAPYGYYTKESEKGLQLYSNGVMIMDKCEQLVPDYFRFVKGIVDSQDLSLNISRELLQHDRQLNIIAKNIEKKIKSELQKLLKNSPDKYETFWKAFGLQIKYGIASSYGMNKEALQDLLVFRSSAVDGYTTLADYVSRMPESQKYIYYACGETDERIKSLPQTELCKEKGYEFLYFTDEIDEFVAKTLITYNDKTIMSIASEHAELQSDEEKEKTEKQAEENKELLEFIGEKLNGKIKKAVVSKNLKSHPVYLSAEGAVSIEMEKYFAQMPGDEPKPKADKVLELNADHEVFNALKKAYETDKEKAEKLAKILYNQAVLIAGLSIDNPVEYCDLVCDLF
ncbi:MAG: molecular chaperone HtpG [Acutalibacteraceae bacterium]|nr:molecular chaperone HtpG [Acutalibacteraceae bacterium]